MNKTKLVFATLAIVAGVSLILWAWRVSSDKAKNEKTRAEQLSREIEEYKKLNNDAVDRLEKRIKDVIGQYRNKIPAFVDDATDFGTKIKLIYKGSSDLANKLRSRDQDALEVQRYMGRMFEMHFFSGDALNKAVANQTHQFGEDMDANRKVLYAKLKALWEKDPDVRKQLDLESFIAESDRLLLYELNKHGITLVGTSMASLVGSELIAIAGTYVAKELFTLIAAQMAASSATAAATAGGATAAGTAGGAAAGTPCGPPCVLVGAGVGLVLGVAIDWVMTDRMKNKLTTMLNEYFDNIENTLINGTDKEDGVVEFYRKLSREMEMNEQEAIAAKLKGKKP